MLCTKSNLSSWAFRTFFFDVPSNTEESLLKATVQKWQLQDGVALVGCFSEPFLIGTKGDIPTPEGFVKRRVLGHSILLPEGTATTLFSRERLVDVVEKPAIEQSDLTFDMGKDALLQNKDRICMAMVHVEFGVAVVVGAQCNSLAIGVAREGAKFEMRSDLENVENFALGKLLSELVDIDLKKVPRSIEIDSLPCSCRIASLLEAHKAETARASRLANKEKKKAALQRAAHDAAVSRLSARAAIGAVRAVLQSAREEDAKRARADRLVATVAKRTAAAAIDGVLAAARREDASRAASLAAVRKLNADKAGFVERARLARSRSVAKHKPAAKPKPPVAKPDPKPRQDRCKDGIECKFLGVGCAFWHPRNELDAAPSIVCAFHPYCRQRTICRCLHPAAAVVVAPAKNVVAPPQPVPKPVPSLHPAAAPESVVVAPPQPVPKPVPKPDPKKPTDYECPICFEENDDRHAINCGHTCCGRCAQLQVREGKCFVCSKSVAMSLRIFV